MSHRSSSSPRNRVVRYVDRFSRILLRTARPLGPAFFLSLLSGGSYIFICYGWVYLDELDMMSSVHKYTTILTILSTYLSFIALLVTDPGKIDTPEKLEKARNVFACDEIVYFDGIECVNCRFVKPARSKHCSLCRACIMKCDHHCVWIDGCVGYYNHRFFVLWLLLLCWLTLYGSYVTGSMVYHMGYVESHWSRPFMVMYGGGEQKILFPLKGILSRALPVPKAAWIAFLTNPLLTALFAFSLLTVVVSVGFAAHHLYTTLYRGMTAREAHSWDRAADLVREQGYVFVYTKGWRANVSEMLWPDWDVGQKGRGSTKEQ